MRFETISFITLFLPLTLVIYYSVARFLKIQNGLLLLASLLFYYVGTTNFFASVILVSCIIWNWLGGLFLERQMKKNKYVRSALYIGIGGNLFILVSCRVLNQWSEITNQLFNHWMLPLGISWVVLQGIGYFMEVFLKETTAEKNIFMIALYIAFFPKIAYGPLIDFSIMKNQFLMRNYEMSIFVEGIHRFVIGMSKKVLIADQFAYFLQYAFVQSSLDNTVIQSSVTMAWLALFVNGIYYYFLLSGYADMAIGLAKMFGFSLPENFDNPFIATSLTDFWKRWNITLIRWFRKYFFSLVNLKKNRDQVIINLFVIWLLIGLWYGFGWQFIFWGAFNFVILIVEYFFYFSENNSYIILRRVYTTLTVFFGFIFLRSQSLYHTGQFFSDLFGLNNNGFYDDRVMAFIRELWIPIILSCYIMFIHPLVKEKIKTTSVGLLKLGNTIGILLLYILCLLFMLLGFQANQIFA